MAELIGIVSGVAGIAGFAMQALETTKKLNSLWADIEDAPADLAAIAQQLATLATVLGSMTDFTPLLTSPTAMSPALDQCHQDCRQALNRLEKTVQQLEQQVSKRRRLVGLKYYLKKEIIRDLKEQLESTKSTLLLMQQAYSGSQIVTMNAQMAAVHTMLITLSQRQSNQMANALNSLSTSKSPLIESNEVMPGSRSRGKRMDRAKPWKLSIPAWWLSKIWTFQMQRCHGGWNYSLRTQRLVPDDSPVFLYAQTGDLAGLQQLFETGRASSWDINSEGETPLHMTVDHVNLETARFLLEHGADVNASCGSHRPYMTPLWCLCRYINRPYCPEFTKLVRLFVEQYGYDDSELGDRQPLRSFPLPSSRDQASKAKIDFLIVRDAVFPSFERAPLRERAALIPEHSLTVPEVLYWYLGQKPLSQECFGGNWGRANLLPLIYYNIFNDGRRNDMNYTQREEWRSIIREVVKFGGHLCLEDAQVSPMVMYLSELSTFGDCHLMSMSRLAGGLRTDLMAFIQELANAGADLVEFAQSEIKFMSGSGNQPSFRHRVRVGNYTKYMEFRIVGFTWGKEVDDWNIFVSNPLDEWAGDFWHWVENPELFGPGAWIDDNDDNDDDDVDYPWFHLPRWPRSWAPGTIDAKDQISEIPAEETQP